MRTGALQDISSPPWLPPASCPSSPALSSLLLVEKLSTSTSTWTCPASGSRIYKYEPYSNGKVRGNWIFVDIIFKISGFRTTHTHSGSTSTVDSWLSWHASFGSESIPPHSWWYKIFWKIMGHQQCFILLSRTCTGTVAPVRTSRNQSNFHVSFLWIPTIFQNLLPSKQTNWQMPKKIEKKGVIFSRSCGGGVGGAGSNWGEGLGVTSSD